MNSFTADWLTLREPADAAARSLKLASALDVFPRDRALRIVDLGGGTGANVRYLADRLPPEQHWLIIDHDPVLLAAVPERMCSWASARGYQCASEAGEFIVRGERLMCTIQTRCADLAVLTGSAVFENCALVTASALLDLVSEQWLCGLVDLCERYNAAALLALTYDGRIRCDPAESEDGAVRDLVNRHQRSDKGFGVALGPEASACAERWFSARGYRVLHQPSDWRLAPEAGELQAELLEGWARAAIAVSPGDAVWIESWLGRRLAHVQAGRSRIVVGHQDLAAWPPARAA